jgi:hypothetical protein
MVVNTWFFDRQSLHVGHVSEGSDSYQHTFGGPVRHEGTILPGLDQPAHLLYLFNRDDPQLGLAMPGIQWLPIYYAFGAEYGPFCYRVVSDDRIEILSKPFGKKPDRRTLAFRQEFPAELRLRKVRISSSPYNPRDPIDLSLYGLIFGVDMLSEDEKLKLKRLIEKKHSNMIFDPHGGPPYDCLEELIDNLGSTLFPHGSSEQRCPGADCKKRRKGREMTLWMQIQAEEDDRGDYKKIYKAIAGADSGELRVLLCPHCHTVCIKNPCT